MASARPVRRCRCSAPAALYVVEVAQVTLGKIIRAAGANLREVANLG
jgi:hypothetical protein